MLIAGEAVDKMGEIQIEIASALGRRHHALFGQDARHAPMVCSVAHYIHLVVPRPVVVAVARQYGGDVGVGRLGAAAEDARSCRPGSRPGHPPSVDQVLEDAAGEGLSILGADRPEAGNTPQQALG